MDEISDRNVAKRELASFGKVALTGYLAIATGVFNVLIALLLIQNGNLMLILLTGVVGGSALVAGVGLKKARTIDGFLLWAKVYSVAVVVGILGSVVVTGTIGGPGLLPSVVLVMILLIFHRMVKAGAVTSKSIFMAQEKPG